MGFHLLTKWKNLLTKWKKLVTKWGNLLSNWHLVHIGQSADQMGKCRPNGIPFADQLEKSADQLGKSAEQMEDLWTKWQPNW